MEKFCSKEEIVSVFNLTVDIDQLSKIFEVLGTPQDPTLTQLCSARVLKYLRTWPKRQKANFAVLFPRCEPAGLDLLDKLLAFDPNNRITATQGLSHPYLATYHVPDDEPLCPKVFDFSFETVNTIPEIKSKRVVSNISRIDFQRSC